jgi:hypothetical protein
MFVFDVLVSCIVILSGVVVLEFEFCADTDRSAPMKATETIKTNKRMRLLVVYLFTVLLLLLLHRAHRFGEMRAQVLKLSATA